jgi:hypothetical protein
MDVYPIGRFVAPAAPSADALRVAVDRIAALPVDLRAALEGCHELDQPIRPGAWSVRALAHHLADSHLNAFTRTKLALTEEAPLVRAYDEVAWSRTADATGPVAPSLAILDGIHARWGRLFADLDDAEWRRPWRHPDEADALPLWRLPLAYAWHGDHHVAQIVQARRAYRI